MVVVHDQSIFEWVWHDADLVMAQVNWSIQGDVTVILRCVLNSEEDTSGIQQLGITTQPVDITFLNVWSWQVSAVGDTASREVIDHWNILKSSPIIATLRRRVPDHLELHHHNIACVGGTTMDVVFQQVALSEAHI